MSKTTYTELELINLLKNKSEAGYTYLYDNYSSTLYGIILKVVKSEESAQDVLQDTFIKIWKNISTYDSAKGKLFTWMLNIARNKAIDFNRSKHVKYQIRMDSHIVSNLKEQGVNENYDHIGIKKAVEKLKPEYREVLDIIYFGGFTQSEASKELNLPLGTLKTRARGALSQLRILLKDTISG